MTTTTTTTNNKKKKTWKERELICIAISKKNYETLKGLGFVGDSFNTVLSRIFETYPDMSRETLSSSLLVKEKSD